jgi:ferredoxin
VEPDGKETTVEASLGEHLLDVAHANNIELEGTLHRVACCV